MPQVYQHFGIRFQYPDNWTLDEEEAVAGNQSVAVYSPQGGFWSVAVHPPRTPRQPLADAALAAMREEYDNLDAEEVTEIVAGHKLTGYDINFYCLDLTSTALVRTIDLPEAVVLIFCQAEDREYAKIGPVFEAITRSLLALRP
ncbi:MAG: hypothetical protein AB7U73_09085 [Pirellulales bacterium]